MLTLKDIIFFICLIIHYLGNYYIFLQFSVVFHLALMQMAKERLDASMNRVNYLCDSEILFMSLIL